jgi:hypothetical protein
MTDRVDADVDAAKAPVGEPVLDALRIDSRSQELRPRHASVLGVGEPRGNGEYSPHMGE